MVLEQLDKLEKRAIRSAQFFGRQLEAHALTKLNKNLVPKVFQRITLRIG